MLESLESEDEWEKKRKLEGKETGPSDDAMFLRRDLIDALTRLDENMETYSKKAGEKMDKFDEKTESNSKKTEEGDDRHKKKKQ